MNSRADARNTPGELSWVLTRISQNYNRILDHGRVEEVPTCHTLGHHLLFWRMVTIGKKPSKKKQKQDVEAKECAEPIVIVTLQSLYATDVTIHSFYRSDMLSLCLFSHYNYNKLLL